MKKFFITILLMFTFIASVAFAQEINIDGYTNYQYGLDSDDSLNSFNVSEVYLGGSYDFDENWSGGATLVYDGMVKNVDLYTVNVDYVNTISKDVDLNVSLGRLENKWFSYTNDLWGNYFINEPVLDRFDVRNTTLEGVQVSFINEKVSGTVELFDANTIIKGSKQLSVNLFLTPIKNLKVAGFYTQVPDSNTIYGVNAYYLFNLKKVGDFKISAEYDNAETAEVYSVYSEYMFSDSPFSLLVRYDNYRVDNSLNNTYWLGGLNYTPNDNLKLGLNWSSVNAKHSVITLNTGISF